MVDALHGLVDGCAAVQEGRLKATAWLQQCLAQIDLWEPKVGAFEYLDRDLALKAATDLDQTDWARQKPVPALAGAPVAMKDIFNTIDMPTSMGSDIRRGYQAGNDARVMEQAKVLGAFCLGKTTTAEFAVHTIADTLNPWDPGIIAGSSSTGSAVAVATGMTPAALGTQSAGSITRPSSYNGVVGFKPTFGLVPRTGVLKTCDTLDSVGWITRNVRDARLLLDCLRVRGHNYPHIVRGLRSAETAYPQDRPWRIGLGKVTGQEAASNYAIEELEGLALQLGNRRDIEIVELDLSEPLKGAQETHRTIYHKSLSYYFTRDLAHIDKVSEIFKDITSEGERYSAEDYHEALGHQELLTDAFDDAMQGVDAFLTLSTAGEAPAIGVPEPDDTSLIWTLCGAPSISLPIFTSSRGRPFGAQIVARRYFDYALLDLAKSVFPGDSALAIATPDMTASVRESA